MDGVFSTNHKVLLEKKINELEKVNEIVEKLDAHYGFFMCIHHICSTFHFFGIVRLFSKKSSNGPFNFLMLCDKMDENLKAYPLARQFGPTFGFFRYCRREYFDTLKSFCYF